MIQIPIPDNFSFKECLWFLDRGYDECLHKVADHKVRKLFEFNNSPVLVEISEGSNNLNMEVLEGHIDQPNDLIVKVKEWFDVEADLLSFYKKLASDNNFSFLAVKYAGLRLISIPDLYEALCWSIIGQQINLKFAYQIKRSLVESCGKYIVFENQHYYLFPKPIDLIKLSTELFQEMKFSRQKIEYILGISQAFLKDEISKEKVLALNTHQSRVSFLTSFKGIGEWTAEYSLMKSLRSSQSVPFGDAGINQALFNIMNIPKKNNRKEVEKVFNSYKGHEAYLVFYLWRSLSEG